MFNSDAVCVDGAALFSINIVISVNFADMRSIALAKLEASQSATFLPLRKIRKISPRKSLKRLELVAAVVRFPTLWTLRPYAVCHISGLTPQSRS